MTEITAKLSTALADRYKIERHLDRRRRRFRTSVQRPLQEGKE